MPNFDLEVEVDEFFDSCNSYEKKELADLVIDEGLASPLKEYDSISKSMGFQHQAYIHSIDSLKSLYFSLSSEDIEKIIELSRKYS